MWCTCLQIIVFLYVPSVLFPVCSLTPVDLPPTPLHWLKVEPSVCIRYFLNGTRNWASLSCVHFFRNCSSWWLRLTIYILFLFFISSFFLSSVALIYNWIILNNINYFLIFFPFYFSFNLNVYGFVTAVFGFFLSNQSYYEQTFVGYWGIRK